MFTLVRVYLTPMAVSWRETRGRSTSLGLHKLGAESIERTDILVPHSDTPCLHVQYIYIFIWKILVWGKTFIEYSGLG